MKLIPDISLRDLLKNKTVVKHVEYIYNTFGAEASSELMQIIIKQSTVQYVHNIEQSEEIRMSNAERNILINEFNTIADMFKEYHKIQNMNLLIQPHLNSKHHILLNCILTSLSRLTKKEIIIYVLKAWMFKTLNV